MITQFLPFLLFGGGLLIGALSVYLFFFPQLVRLKHEHSQLEQQDERFRLLALDVMKASQEQLLILANEKMQQGHATNTNEMEKRQTAIGALVDPVNKTLAAMDEKLKALEEARLGAYSELRAQLHLLAQDQNKLRTDTASLVQALKSSSVRGQWGELQLKRCLDMAGLQEGVHYTAQVHHEGDEGNRLRPDVIINLPGGKKLVIDAKAPMTAYLEAHADGIDETTQKMHLANHARALRDHIRALSQKSYWQGLDTPEFVILFLPGESYFSAALQADPTLLEAGVEQKVIPASPTTLISLCKAVMYGWKQEKMADSARAIAALGQELYKRLGSFTGHLESVGSKLEGTIKSYNAAVGSMERMVMPSARRFKDYGVGHDGKELPELRLIETSPIMPTPNEMMSDMVDTMANDIADIRKTAD
jgi:DNA recombination protein RmuC